MKTIWLALCAVCTWAVVTLWQMAGYDYYMIHEKFETKRGK